ncbi:unnamed protein product [Pleuronectes platessa]|uniref:Uncharacterized protein n=1 Tax=Pleuronectes platessa TaxID=8262 RepID=A0A9N7U620_PLEPL|nr:unnamed protein product [Pleuronectes platessa]
MTTILAGFLPTPSPKESLTVHEYLCFTSVLIVACTQENTKEQVLHSRQQPRVYIEETKQNLLQPLIGKSCSMNTEALHRYSKSARCLPIHRTKGRVGCSGDRQEAHKHASGLPQFLHSTAHSILTLWPQQTEASANQNI